MFSRGAGGGGGNGGLTGMKGKPGPVYLFRIAPSSFFVGGGPPNIICCFSSAFGVSVEYSRGARRAAGTWRRASARAAGRAGRCRAGMAGRGEGGEMRIKTEETLAPRLSTFHFPHENSRAGHVARRQSPHRYYLFILPILLLLIINLFVLVCICFQKRRETFARPCPITPQEEGMLPIPSPSALHNARCNQNTGKTRQCSIVATAGHVRPFTSTFMAPLLSAAMHPATTPAASSPAHLRAANGSPHPVGLS